MAIKYNPYNWEIRPRKENKDCEIKFNVDIDEDKIIQAILDNIDISLIDESE